MRHRKQLKMSIAGLLAALAVLSFMLAPAVNRYHRLSRDLGIIRKCGGTIQFDLSSQRGKSAMSRLARLILGEQFFVDPWLVSVSNTPISEETLEAIGRIKSLRNLTFSQCDLRDEHLRHLAGSTELTNLSIVRTEITGDGLRYLQGLHNLEFLSLTQNNLDDEAMRHVTHFSHLRRINLDFTPITSRGLALAELGAKDNLEHVLLSFTYIDDSTLLEIRQLPQLKSLTVFSTPVTEDACREFAAERPDVDFGYDKMPKLAPKNRRARRGN